MKLTENLYSVTKIEDDRWSVVLADKNHPVFKAHFELNPILPAFLQIDIIAEILSKKIIEIKKAKFALPIKPNDNIVYCVVEKNSSARVKIFNQDNLVSSFSIIYE